MRAIIFAIGVICPIFCLVYAVLQKQPISAILGVFIIVITFDMTYLMINNPNQLPYDALYYNGHHYYIYSDSATSWRDAMNKCNDRGGYLAVINDEQENEELFAYMKKIGYDQAYFGLAKTVNGDWDYLYNSKETSGYRNWGFNSKGEKEPNDSGGEHHVELDIYMYDGHWNDAEFGRQIRTPSGVEYKDTNAYICEWNY